MPAQAGIRRSSQLKANGNLGQIPASAGMTVAGGQALTHSVMAVMLEACLRHGAAIHDTSQQESEGTNCCVLHKVYK